MPTDIQTYRLIFDKSFTSGALNKAKDEFTEEITSQYSDHPEKQTIILNSGKVERHVKEVIKKADLLSPNEYIDPANLFEAIIVKQEEFSNSRAFKAFVELFKSKEPEKITELINEPPKKEKPPRKGIRFEQNSFILSANLGYVLKVLIDTKDISDIRSGFWGRDLITIILMCNSDDGLREATKVLGYSLSELQDRWYAFLNQSKYTSRRADYAGWWRLFNIPLPKNRNRRAGYLPEEVDMEDKLGISSESWAFAQLIADENTSPPLSIGLIGDWGSGKSFFMKHIQDHVINRLNNTDGYCKNIAQIEFNAWHYSDANLWASLIDHIFSGIWKQMDKKDDEESNKKVRERLNEELNQAKGALFEAEQQLGNTRTSLNNALEKKEEYRKTYALKKILGETKSKLISKGFKMLGWNATIDSFHSLDTALSELKNSSNQIKIVLKAALSGRSIRSIIMPITVILILCGLLFIVGNKYMPEFLNETVKFISVIGGITGSVISAIIAPLKTANSKLKSVVYNIESAYKEYDRNPKNKEKILDIRKNHELLSDKIKLLKDKITRLEEEKLNTDPFQRLVSFVRDQALSEKYRSQQGIISLVRRDFQKLSKLLANAKDSGDPVFKDVEPVDRIILFIDDLDRCSSETVVHTLEAIHLLMALDLFIVVVGVDSRWLLRSLDVHYKTLLNYDENHSSNYRISTPQNYLEKIFQLTYALSPMSQTGFGMYIDYLTGEEALQRSKQKEEPEKPKELTPATISKDDGVVKPVKIDASLDVGLETTEEQNPEDESSEENIEVGSEVVANYIRNIQIKQFEKEFIKKLHPLIQTPRIAKRIVNIYRIIKAKHSISELDNIEIENGRHQPILLLLAVLFRYSIQAEDIFRHLSERTLGNSKNSMLETGIKAYADTLKNQLNKLEEENNEQLAEEIRDIELKIEQLNLISGTIKELGFKVKISSCEKEAFEVSKYSLITGQVHHTWKIN